MNTTTETMRGVMIGYAYPSSPMADKTGAGYYVEIMDRPSIMGTVVETVGPFETRMEAEEAANQVQDVDWIHEYVRVALHLTDSIWHDYGRAPVDPLAVEVTR